MSVASTPEDFDAEFVESEDVDPEPAEPADVDAETKASSEGEEDPQDDTPRDAPPTGRTYRWLELRRSSDDRLVGGVAGGIGEFFAGDPVIIRIAFIFLTLIGGFGVALYLAS